jgi:sn-glycerol 3-phosphate transport system ATP-binding protein/multiple sugar transport system ATP-binding protein
MNFLPVNVDGDTIRLPGGGALTRSGMRQGAAELGVRPERIRVVGQDAQAHMRGAVRVLEPLGADTLVLVDCAGHKVMARLPGNCSLRLSDPVLLALEPEGVILFDQQTGRR